MRRAVLYLAAVSLAAAGLAPHAVSPAVGPTPRGDDAAEVDAAEFLRFSADPVASSSGRGGAASIRFVNDATKTVSVAWADADGVLRHRRSVAPGRGRRAIVDGSYRAEHCERTAAGDAFAIWVGADDAPPTTNAALCACARAGTVDVVGWVVATDREPGRERVVTVRRAARGFTATRALGPSVPASAPHRYAYRLARAGGFRVDVDERCDGARVETFLADVEAAAERLPAVARRALRRAGCRFVVHEETGDLRETAYGRFDPIPRQLR